MEEPFFLLVGSKKLIAKHKKHGNITTFLTAYFGLLTFTVCSTQTVDSQTNLFVFNFPNFP